MSRTNRWIKVWIKAFNDPLFQGNIPKFGFWIWCCGKAVTADGDYPLGNKMVHLKRGQFIYGKKAAHLATGIAESTLYIWLKQFEKLEMIHRRPVNHEYTIIEVSKYKAYQDNYSDGNNHDINHVEAHVEAHLQYHEPTTVVEDKEGNSSALKSAEHIETPIVGGWTTDIAEMERRYQEELAKNGD